jgi:hypothetical protein
MSTTRSPATVEVNANAAGSANATEHVDIPEAFGFDVALSTAVTIAVANATVPIPAGPLVPQMLDKMHRYWRADNYL